MREVFSDENRTRKYLEFEAALATVCRPPRHHPGGMPRRRSAQSCRARQDRHWTKLAGTPSVSARRCSGVVHQLAARYAETGWANIATGARRIQDVTDTRDDTAGPRGARLSSKPILRPSSTFARRSGAAPSRHADGRAQLHLQHAVPITFGFKIATLLSAVERASAAARRSCARAFWSASSPARSARLRRFPAGGLDTQAGADECARASVSPTSRGTRHRDRIAEVGCFLAW